MENVIVNQAILVINVIQLRNVHSLQVGLEMGTVMMDQIVYNAAMMAVIAVVKMLTNGTALYVFVMKHYQVQILQYLALPIVLLVRLKYFDMMKSVVS